MATKEINKTKILVKVHEPLITIMQHKMEAACLKRDAYLDKALRAEAEFLRKEITTPNSDKAKNYIATQLSKLSLKPLNLLLSTETVELINEVCKEKNVPRDAFINRFCLLLIATDTVLEAVFIDDRDSENALSCDMKYLFEFAYADRDERYFFDRPNILDTLEEFVTTNPFFRMRSCLEYQFNEQGDIFDGRDKSHKPLYLYMFYFYRNALQKLPDDYKDFKIDNALGFNTFMSDEEVSKEEELDAALDEETNEKCKTNDWLAIMQKEKQAREEKAKQARLEKAQAKSEGDVK